MARQPQSEAIISAGLLNNPPRWRQNKNRPVAPLACLTPLNPPPPLSPRPPLLRQTYPTPSKLLGARLAPSRLARPARDPILNPPSPSPTPDFCHASHSLTPIPLEDRFGPSYATPLPPRPSKSRAPPSPPFSNAPLITRPPNLLTSASHDPIPLHPTCCKIGPRRAARGGDGDGWGEEAPPAAAACDAGSAPVWIAAPPREWPEGRGVECAGAPAHRHEAGTSFAIDRRVIEESPHGASLLVHAISP